MKRKITPAIAVVLICVLALSGCGSKLKFNGMKIDDFVDALNDNLIAIGSEVQIDTLNYEDGDYVYARENGMSVTISDGENLHSLTFSVTYYLSDETSEETTQRWQRDTEIILAFVMLLDPKINTAMLVSELLMDELSDVDQALTTDAYEYHNVTSVDEEGLFVVRYLTMKNVPNH